MLSVLNLPMPVCHTFCVGLGAELCATVAAPVLDQMVQTSITIPLQLETEVETWNMAPKRAKVVVQRENEMQTELDTDDAEMQTVPYAPLVSVSGTNTSTHCVRC